MLNNPFQKQTQSTKRYAWLTDIHLEFLKPWDIDTFLDELREQNLDALMLTGDIAQPESLRSLLLQMSRSLDLPIYFVLGNHDFYGSDIPDVRIAMRTLTHEDLGPAWMPSVGVIKLGQGVGLVGHDGWSDGRYGQFFRSPVMLNDYIHIATLRTPSAAERLERLNLLGDEAGQYLRGILTEATESYRRVFILTHPPPFMEACWHNGKLPDEDDIYLPHFTCKAIGDVLLEVASQNPQVKFTVLCGHTHGGGTAQIKGNLQVLTGNAEYGQPTVQRVFEFPG